MTRSKKQNLVHKAKTKTRCTQSWSNLGRSLTRTLCVYSLVCLLSQLRWWFSGVEGERAAEQILNWMAMKGERQKKRKTQKLSPWLIIDKKFYNFSESWVKLMESLNENLRLEEVSFEINSDTFNLKHQIQICWLHFHTFFFIIQPSMLPLSSQLQQINHHRSAAVGVTSSSTQKPIAQPTFQLTLIGSRFLVNFKST